MRFKSSEAVMEVITSTAESEEAMEGGDDGKCEGEVGRSILLDWHDADSGLERGSRGWA